MFFYLLLWVEFFGGDIGGRFLFNIWVGKMMRVGNNMSVEAVELFRKEVFV